MTAFQKAAVHEGLLTRNLDDRYWPKAVIQTESR